jgi:hypothetical protein
VRQTFPMRVHDISLSIDRAHLDYLVPEFASDKLILACES